MRGARWVRIPRGRLGVRGGAEPLGAGGDGSGRLPVDPSGGARRHGQCLAGGAGRRPLCRARGGEAAQRGARRPRRRGSLCARRPHPGRVVASAHRPSHRCRIDAARPALPGARVRGRTARRSPLRRAAPRRGGAPAAVPAGAGPGRPRPRQPDRAPGPETVERAGHGRWAGQAARLRHRPPARRRAGRRRRAGPHPGRRVDAHPGLRRARATHAPAGDHRHRCLFPRRAALRDPGRAPSRRAVPRQPGRPDAGSGARRFAAPVVGRRDPGSRPDARCPGDRDGAADHAGQAGAGVARRPGHDRGHGHADRARRTLRLGRRAGRRPAAPPRPPPDRRASPGRELSRRQVRASQPRVGRLGHSHASWP